jgi:phage regulator Rha-like protein
MINRSVMANNKSDIMLQDEVIVDKIYLIRGKKVMLDRDLAELYNIETKQLKRAVRRNINRFPEDFMFEFSKEELEKWRYQFGTSNREIMGLRVPPFAFTEYCIIMLASVLNSERAIQVNIQVVKVFVKMRELLTSHNKLILELEKMEYSLSKHGEQIRKIFKYLKQFEQIRKQELDQQNRKKVGFRRKNEQ